MLGVSLALLVLNSIKIDKNDKITTKHITRHRDDTDIQICVTRVERTKGVTLNLLYFTEDQANGWAAACSMQSYEF